MTPKIRFKMHDWHQGLMSIWFQDTPVGYVSSGTPGNPNLCFTYIKEEETLRFLLPEARDFLKAQLLVARYLNAEEELAASGP